MSKETVKDEIDTIIERICLDDVIEIKEHHVMLDIETLGVTPGSVVCSIAAVQFNLLTGEIYSNFHQRVTIQSCLNVGLTINGETLEWWMKQSNEARKEITSNDKKSLQKVLSMFTDYLNKIDINSKNIRLWGNGSSFDLGILSSAYEKCKIPVPWKFWNERDVRTVLAIMPSAKEEIKFEGEKHNPLHDCLFQIKYTSLIMGRINNDLNKN